MRRIILFCASAIGGVSAAQATPFDIPQRLAMGTTNALDHGREVADSLSGGPDYWEVTGVGENETLSLRKEPSARAKRLTNLPNGAMLKNLGCSISHGRRWCKVQRPNDPSARGWVNGCYLRESAGPR